MSKLLQVGKAFFSLGKTKVKEHGSEAVEQIKTHATDVVSKATNGFLIKAFVILAISAILFGIAVGSIVILMG